MDTIWLKDKNGKTFSLACNIEESIFSLTSAANAITAPVIVPDADRCISSIDIDGIVKINFDVNGRKGACNQCGVCCSHCKEHLRILTKIGEPGGTECAIHDRLLYEGKKSCLNWPTEPYEIEPYKDVCGFRFEE